MIVRTMPPGSLEQVVYRMDALWRLEAAGVTVLNPPKAVECAVDKYLALVRLEAAGLTVPPTIVCENAEAALEAFDRLGGDVVVKPIFGSEGRGIVRVSDPDLALRTFRTLERIESVLYVQRFIENEGFDVRVLVLDGHVLGGDAAAGQWRLSHERFVPGDGRSNMFSRNAKPNVRSARRRCDRFAVRGRRLALRSRRDVLCHRGQRGPRLAGLSARHRPRRGDRGDPSLES